MENIKLTNSIAKDKYTEYVCEKYDIQDKDTITTEIPRLNLDYLDGFFEWNIGVICGNSGSGKTTILKTLGAVQEPVYNYDKAIISQFPNLDEREACELLCGVGLASVPIWLHKPNELSNGERARLDLAWALANNKDGLVLIDEFTSVVNRPCAKSLSHALQRYARKHGIKLIISSCHFDIIPWLKPDWIFDLNRNNNGEVDLMHFLCEENYNSYSSVKESDVLSKPIIMKE